MSDNLKKTDKAFIATFRMLSLAAKELAQVEVPPKTAKQFIDKWVQLAEQSSLFGNLNALRLLNNMLSGLLNRYPDWQRLICHYKGRLAWITGDYNQALRCFQEQLQLARTLKDQVEEAFYLKAILLAQLDLAEVLLTLNQEAEVEHALWQGLHLSYEHSLELPQLQFLNRLARFYQLQENFENSLDCLEQAHILLATLKQKTLPDDEKTLLGLEEAFSWHWWGAYYLEERDWRGAERALKYSLDLSYSYRDSLGVVETLLKLGVVYYQLDYLDNSLICFEGSLANCEQLYYRPAMLRANYYKSLLYFKLERYQEALNPARLAVEIGLESGQDYWLALAYYNLGQVYHQLETANLGLTCHLRVVELYQTAKNKQSFEWIELLIKVGNFLIGLPLAPDYWEQALDCYRQALELIEVNQKLEYLAPVMGRIARTFTKVRGLAGLDEAARCYRLELQLAGDLDSVALPPALAVALRVEALTGLQCCAALKSNRQYQPVFPVVERAQELTAC